MTLKNFPKRYEDAPECVGDGWWGHYSKAMDAVNQGGIVLLYGGHGTGKTRLSYEIAKKCEPPRMNYRINGISKTAPAIYTTAVEMFMDIRSTYHRASEITEKTLIERLSSASLLVIDEVQERGETEFEDRKLNQIIDARYKDGRPTILISNHTRQGFAKTLSPAVLDRIRENGVGLHFDWQSYRGLKAGTQ